VKVAIKTLLPLEETGYNIVDEWISEANAQKTLDRLENAHITRGLAAYSQHEQYSIVFEWADGGSLRSFWKEHPKPKMSKKSIMELLRQLHGLADALASMHDMSVSSPRSHRGSSASSISGVQIRDFQHAASSQPTAPEIVIVDSKNEIVAPEAIGPPPIIVEEDMTPRQNFDDDPIIRPLSRQSTRIGENWRHGDITPDNILRFETDGTWLGTLKLADLGRAKQRYLATRELPNKEIDAWRTKPYEAPDIWISKGEASMSRLYDCWGMGCVFFEAIVWMLYGQQAIWNFDETTTKAQKEGTPYWSRVGDSDAEVSQLVRGWMDHILEEDPECNRKGGTVMGDLMKLVKKKLFQIHLPPDSDVYMDGFRTNAKDMRQDLWAILVRAEAEEEGQTDDQYIFTGSDRSTVHPPSIDPEYMAAQDPKPLQSFLPVPGRGRRPSLAVPTTTTKARGGAITTRRNNQYTHSLNDVWKYVDDDEFVISVLQRNKFPFSNLFSVAESTICKSCAEIGHHFAHFVFDRTMRELRKAVTSKSCDLCALLFKAASKVKIAGTATVTFSTSPAGLRINDKNRGDLVLRFCRSWGKSFRKMNGFIHF
jgi:serine/threonine protein kinase